MKSFGRRTFIAFLTGVAVLAPNLPRRVGPSEGEEFVIVNGWILRKSDLETSA